MTAKEVREAYAHARLCDVAPMHHMVLLLTALGEIAAQLAEIQVILRHIANNEAA